MSRLRLLLALALAMLSPWVSAGDSRTPSDAATRESLGMYVASLQESLAWYRGVRGLAAPSEHQAGVLELALRDAQMVRLHIASRARALAPDSREAEAVRQFLEAWPEERFAEGVRASARESKLDPAVRRLARVLPQAGDTAPLFPFFRP